MATSHHNFRGQRIRQAYDSQAQPFRLCAELSLLPLAILLRRRPIALGFLAAGTMLVAEWGRRRVRHVFPFSAVLFAPLWVGERAITSWIALARRATGGIPYAGGRLIKAASCMRDLRKAAEAQRMNS